MKEQVASAKTVVGIVGLCLLVMGVVYAEAAPVTWHYAGDVSSYTCLGPNWDQSPCTLKIDAIVPLGTPVDLVISFDTTPTLISPAIPCLVGKGNVSMTVLGQTLSGTSFIWDEGHGFGPGTCHPGEKAVEIVVPSWGFGQQLFGLSTFTDQSLIPGLLWAGDMQDTPPFPIFTFLPYLYSPGPDGVARQRFNVAQFTPVAPVLEPGTWLLLTTGLAAAWRRRRAR